ncbi:MAG: hypothetical protein AAFX93_19860 [Verrucomicrobiota bacterium]
MKNTIIFYDGDMDGFAGAWAAWTLFGNDGAEYVMRQRDRSLAEQHSGVAEVLTRGVQRPELSLYCIDFCPSREELLLLDETIGKVQVIDHHATTKEVCGDLTNLVTCDTSRSACALAWQVFHCSNPPLILLFVEDRDLWRWQMEYSPEVNAWLSSLESFKDKDLEGFNAVSRLTDWDRMRSEGSAILRSQESWVDFASQIADYRKFEERLAVVVNSPIFRSEIGSALLEKCPEADLALCWWEHNGIRHYSLRSRGADECDVGKIAENFGGGGHPQAAGFAVCVEETEVIESLLEPVA